MPTQNYDLSSCLTCCQPINCDFGCGCMINREQLHATLQNIAGCDCLDGVVIALNYIREQNIFIGLSDPTCNDNGCQLQVVLTCNGGSVEVDCVNCNGATGQSCAGQVGQIDIITCTCDPLFLKANIALQDLPSNPCGAGHICCAFSGALLRAIITV